jgi:hypothetical protein
MASPLCGIRVEAFSTEWPTICSFALAMSVIPSYKEKSMRKIGIRCVALAALGVLMTAFASVSSMMAANADEKPKYTIKEVMEQAHKSGLLKKVSAGTADKADREKLAELYKALMESKPPKGDAEEWKKTTTVLHKIAEDAIKDPDAGKKLKVNCGQCHGKFKG